MHIIRRLNLGEAEIYRSVRLEALRDAPHAFLTTYESALLRDRESWTAQADGAAQGGDRAIFLAFDEHPIGMAALFRYPQEPSVGELLQMWVAPSQRGCGVAADLLRHVFQWASSESFVSIRAEVTPTNLGALRFYEKQGFQQRSAEGGDRVLTRPVNPVSAND